MLKRNEDLKRSDQLVIPEPFIIDTINRNKKKQVVHECDLLLPEPYIDEEVKKPEHATVIVIEL